MGIYSKQNGKNYYYKFDYVDKDGNYYKLKHDEKMYE